MNKVSASPAEARLASQLREAVRRKEEREAKTVRIYSIYRRRIGFSVPFPAPSDAIALSSLKEISRTCKEIQRSDLYRFGSFCVLDGKLTKEKKPVLVKG